MSNNDTAFSSGAESSWLLYREQRSIYLFLNILFSCFTISSNLVFLVAIAGSTNLQTVSNFFLCSLSVADLSAGILVFPLYSAIAILGVSPSGLWLSQIEKFVWIQTLVSTTFSLTLVSIDRYIAVLYPLKYYLLVSEQRCLASIICVWILSVAFALPAPFLTEKGVAIIWAVDGVIAVVLPFCIISFCYFHIFKVVRHQSRRVDTTEISMPPSSLQTDSVHASGGSVRRHHRSAITTFIIVGLFLLLFSPNFIFAFMYVLTEEEACEQAKVLRPWLWGVLVAYSGSFIDPWIYGLRTKEIKNVVKRMFKCR